MLEQNVVVAQPRVVGAAGAGPAAAVEAGMAAVAVAAGFVGAECAAVVVAAGHRDQQEHVDRVVPLLLPLLLLLLVSSFDQQQQYAILHLYLCQP